MAGFPPPGPWWTFSTGAVDVNENPSMTQVEDELLALVAELPKWKKAIIYKYFYNLGINLNNADSIIKKKEE